MSILIVMIQQVGIVIYTFSIWYKAISFLPRRYVVIFTLNLDYNSI